MATRPARPARPVAAPFDPLAAARKSVSTAMATATANPVRLPFEDQECSVIFAIKSVRFQQSNNPSKVGQVFFCTELEVVESNHPKCVEGKSTSWTRFCVGDPNNKEIASFLLAMTGLALEDDELAELMVDDGILFAGCKVQCDVAPKYSKKHDKTFFNPHWSHVELTQEALDAISALGEEEIGEANPED